MPNALLLVFVIPIAASAAAWGQSGEPITALAIAPDSTVVLAGQAGIRGERFTTRLPHVHDLVFSPNRQWLVAAGGDPAESGGAELFPIGDAALAVRRHAAITEDVIYSAAWSPDGSLLALASLDGSCVLMRPANGTIVRRIRGHSRGVTAVTFLSPELMATASLDHTIRVWNVGTGELQRTLKNHTAPVSGLALRPDTESGLAMLASISRDRTVRLWQPTIGRMVRFVRLDSPPLSVAWFPDGSHLVVAATDGSVRIIDPDTVEIEHRLAGIKSHAWCLAVTPDGKQIIVAGAGGEVVRLAVPNPAR